MPRKKTAPAAVIESGRVRAVIEGVSPEIDGGLFPIRRAVGETVVVEADAFADGHDALAARLLYRREGEGAFRETPMHALGNDRWCGEFAVGEVGRYVYTVTAWVDAFLSWQRDLHKRLETHYELPVAYAVGADMVRAAAARARGPDARRLGQLADALASGAELEEKQRIALSLELARLMERYPDRRFACTYARELPVVVERARARFGSWYEFFPRSCGREGRHGSLRDCEARLEYAAHLGFDVVYLPPIHPIGRSARKGKNNALSAAPDDVGSPWAIGADAGGHKDVHPQLGTVDDFRWFVGRAKALGLEVALDVALQCAPDHPYVTTHPQWFRRRPDGSVQYAENPPKKYQDIYPINFESDDWRALWDELKGVVEYWIEQGVRVFRVDNPHTKPFSFWAWVIAEIKRDHPEVIFLAEAFTRPKVMERLAKLGFTQSYTYFTWRNTKHELTEYFTHLTQTPVREYFWPNLWPNTPDILHEYLQHGGRAAFIARAVLAATLAANYGVYGPAFELMETMPARPGSEEYFNSEKYQLREWHLERPDSLAWLLARLNHARRENLALQHDWGLRFHTVDNPELICFSKCTEDRANVVLVVVNLDPRYVQSGFVELALGELGLPADQPYQVHDLLSDARYLWRGARNYVRLDPHEIPAHLFRVLPHAPSERDFEHYA